jgi:hypothetical protein
LVQNLIIKMEDQFNDICRKYDNEHNEDSFDPLFQNFALFCMKEDISMNIGYILKLVF